MHSLATEEKDAAVVVDGLSKAYRDHLVLDRIGLTVRRGTIHALLGANGAGKTTLVSILATLVRADAGRATVDGHDVQDEPDQVRRRLCMTGQAAAVDEVLTGRENLRMMAGLSGLRRAAARARTEELLSRFDLLDRAGDRVGTYSGGTRRRLDIALSLVVPPRVLFLDEPTTGLDPRSRFALWELIRSLREDGTTVLLTTQYLEEADRLADRISVLRDGRIVAEGTPADLKAEVGGEVAVLTAPDGTVLHTEATDGTLQGLRTAIEAFDDRGIDGLVSLRRPSLDDVFLALTDPEAARAPQNKETAA